MLPRSSPYCGGKPYETVTLSIIPELKLPNCSQFYENAHFITGISKRQSLVETKYALLIQLK